MRSPVGDQDGKLSAPVVRVLIDPSANVRTRKPRCPTSPRTRYTSCLPSGEKLGNPLLADPSVNARLSDASACINMIRAGVVAPSQKMTLPNETHSSSGDHEDAKAIAPSSSKTGRA